MAINTIDPARPACKCSHAITPTSCIFPSSTSEATIQDGTPYSSSLSIKLDASIECQLLNQNREVQARFVLAAWAVTLRYYIGQDGVTFGYNSAQSSVERKVIDTRIFHASITKETVLGSFVEHKEQCFLASVCETCAAARESSQEIPLYNTEVLTENMNVTDLDAARGNNILSLAFSSGPPKAKLSYRCYKISASRAEDIVFTFTTALSQIVLDINRTPRDLILHTPSQLQLFRDRIEKTPVMVEKCIHDTVYKHVVLTPSAPAITGHDGHFSYSELYHAARLLTSELQKHGVKKGSAVPVLSEKSVWVPIAMLAIVSAGASWVLLDVNHPAEYLENIIAQVEAKVILISAAHPSLRLTEVKAMVELSSTAAWYVEGNEKEIPENKTVVHPTDVAYLVFTSGSTGTPKGVMIQQNQIVTSCFSFGPVCGVTDTTRALQFASHAFDITVSDILAPLLVGGCVVIPSEEQRMNDLAAACRLYGVNYMQITPSYARQLKPSDIPMMRKMAVGGESPSRDILALWGPTGKLIQGYGPSECSVWSTMSEVTIDMNPTDLGNTTGCSAFITQPDDPSMLLPDGTQGELLLMGPIVARGYLDEPEKTAKAFILQPNWFKEPNYTTPLDTNRRIYRTGDMAYLKSDGSVVFCGRIDTQVKIRGQRIELGEIEAQLRHVISDLDDVAVEVLCLSEDRSNKGLAAFVSLKSDWTGDKQLLPHLKQIQTDVAARLPQHMRPDVYIPLERIPLTQTQKIDRKKLRALQYDINQIAAFNGFVCSFQAPSTPMQLKLQQLWADILDIDKATISLDHSFLMLGGDSLKAIRLAAIAREVGLNLAFDQIFRYPSLQELAEHVHEVVWEEAAVQPWDLIPDEEREEVLAKILEQCGEDIVVEDVYPSTPEQDRMLRESVRHELAMVNSSIYELGPEINIERLCKTFEKIIEGTPILRTRLVDIDGASSVQVVVNESIPFKLVTTVPADSELQPSFGRRLFKFAVIAPQNSGGRYRLKLIMQHSIMDAWSLRLLWKAIESIYLKGGSIPPNTPFNRVIKYNLATDSAKFWRDYLAEARPSTLLHLPTPGYIPQQTTRISKFVALPTLPYGNITITTTIQVALALTLASLSSSPSIVFRTTRTGRNIPVPGIETVIAPTLTSFPVCISIPPPSSKTTLQTLLATTQARQTAATQHEHLGVNGIATLFNTSTPVCTFDSPYLIVQTAETSGTTGHIPGVTLVEESHHFSRTPLSLACIMKDTGVKINVGYDPKCIMAREVDELLEKFGGFLKRVIESMCEGGGMPVNEAMEG